MSGAARNTLYRRRRDAGQIVLAVTVEEAAVVEMLVAGGKLAAWTEDREAIARALAEQVQTLVDLHRLTV